MIPLWVSIAGGAGALARFIADSLIRSALGRKFPWGTLIINVSGSFILGLLIGFALSGQTNANLVLVIGTGFCGGFTTFSTASFETVRLIEKRRLHAAFFNTFGTLLLTLLSAGVGIALVQLS
jgi:CrcB protein